MNNATNLTLPEIVAELELQKKASHDYVVPSTLISMSEGGLISIPVGDGTNGGVFEPNEVMHQHMALKLGIPANYYKKMQQLAPELLAQNVNNWFQKGDNKLLVRTFQHELTGNVARGMLSDRYGIIDNYDVLFAALRAIQQSGVKVEVKQASVTDKRLYVNITAPDVEVQSEAALKNYLRDSPVGYGIVSGLCITNSEVGFGSYEIRPRVFIKVCSNGMIIKDDAFRKVHLGGRMNEGQIKWSADTQKKNLDLIMAQTGDAIKQFLSEDYLSGVVQKLEAAAGQKLDNPVDTLHNVVKEISKTVTISEESKNNILNYFVNDGDVAASGVTAALTREAQNMDADSRYEIESKVWDILPQIKNFDHKFVVGKN